MAVGKNLDFEVASPRHVFFDQHAIVAEGACCLPLRRGEGRRELRRAGDDPHAPAPAAGGGLDQHRKADPLRLVDKTPRILVFAVIARDDGHPRPLHQRPCR